MIVSASYKTDIPAFYGAWFMNRLRAGSCKMVNPYGKQIYTVPLTHEVVDGFVFWTKNLGPFLDHLGEVRARGFPFVVQYTITGYPRALEYSAPEAKRACEHMRRLADRFGPDCAVWRYDPVIVTSLTPRDWHVRNFARLAKALAGATDEVVISFAHFYAKTRRNLATAARASRFAFEDPQAAWKRETAARLAEIAGEHGMRLNLCSQPEYRAGEALEARCIDAARLSGIAGRPIAAPLKGNRPGCGCYASRDIGEYDTCPMGCVYCYAVQHRTLARRRFAAHDAAGEFLFPPPFAERRPGARARA
jgi:DNA repair photolyase